MISKIKKLLKFDTESVNENIDEETESVLEEEFVDDTVMDIKESDKRKVWAFCAGQYSNDFRGNPKYLFIYINKYRPDIEAYWLCDSVDIILQIREMGYKAYKLNTLQAEQAIDKTGVLVCEQVKMVIPAGLENAVYLNLWHGVGGVKAVERSISEGILVEEIAKKYIEKNIFYRENELYLAPSSFIEKIAIEQLGLSEEKIVRAGYPRCIYQKQYERVETFDHNIIENRGLPKDTRIAAYTPTYRNNQKGELFTAAIPDVARMIEVCEREHILMIFKMHPLLEKEAGFLQAKQAYQDNPWIMFWDNRDDFYEVLDRVDLCIMDYSSIFTDFVLAGVKHFLRYTFDFTGEDLDFPMDYDEVTLGRKCFNYDELLGALTNYESDDLTEDLKRIHKLYWEFNREDSMDRIIDKTVNFVPERKEYKNLYSFDIFDTLISRKVLAPEGIFYYVQEKMKFYTDMYPSYLIENFPQIRANAEANMREYYNRSIVERDDERCEISFEEIYRRIQTVYDISDEAMHKLMEWEMECELDNVIPLYAQINTVKELVKNDETVVLISDMYLPKEFIQKMLAKADPLLATIPLFLSSELGYQKSRKSLYLEVYRQYGTEYNFGKWIHTGDNGFSDQKMARALNIITRKIEAVKFDEYEETLVNELKCYDGYLVAAAMARFRTEHPHRRQRFAYEYISLLFVPYVRWALHSAVKNGDKVVYFISRDGHQLKKIADVIIKEDNLDIEAKYIYASRRTWRIPSFYDHIDVGFWGQGYGNMARVDSLKRLLKALDMNEKEFREIFPEFNNITYETEIDREQIEDMSEIFKNSEKYEKFLLAKAAEERKPVCAYLKQEMDCDKQFSIIEYWGRGYTQENFTRLWHDIKGKKEPVTFYYSRSTLPSDEWNIRKNFTTNTSSQAFIESIFACINYKSIQEYVYKDGRLEPVIEPNDCDVKLFYAMEQFLPKFAKDYCRLSLTDADRTGRALIDFAIEFHRNNQWNSFFTGILAKLVDSVEMYGEKKEYAKEFSIADIEELRDGGTVAGISKSYEMSYGRSTEEVKEMFRELYQVESVEPIKMGVKLTREQIEVSKEYRKKTDQLMMLISEMNKLYDRAIFKHSVEERILVITDAAKFSKEEYGSIINVLDNQDIYKVQKIALGKNTASNEKVAEALAKAKYIITAHPIALLSGIEWRKDTRLILTGGGPISYLACGMAAKYKINTVAKYNKLCQGMEINAVQLPSESCIDGFDKSYNGNTMLQYLVTGNCVTDLYFNEQYKENAKKKLLEEFPESAGKTVICYVPYFRYRNEESKYVNMMDIKLLQEKLGNDYVILVNMHGDYVEGCTNLIEIDGFAKDMTGKMSIRAQFCAADIIVGDYRDSMFETPLLNVPVFMTNWDQDKFEMNRNTLYSMNELQYGVSVKNTEDFAEKVMNIGNYDYGISKMFVEKYLKNCDGHSAEKLFAGLADL